MGSTAEAVVVGAGLNGAATAFFLVQQGFRRVTVVDAEKPGAGASGAGVGLLRSHYDNRPETELAARSMPYFRNWADLIGGQCGWLKTGFFRFVEPDELANMHRNVAVQRELGENVEVLTPEQVRGIAPEFRTDDIGAAIYEPETGTASNSRATYALLEHACARGAVLEPYTKALGIDVQNDRVIGVTTTRERIATPVVVLAAGASSRALAATCGVDLPVEARPIAVAEILPPDGLRLPGSYMDPISDSWLAPRQQGRALIHALAPATAAPPAADDEDPGFSRADAAAGLAPVRRRLPGIASAQVVRWWRRSDSFAPDGKPIIGGVEEVAGLFLNTASAGKGHKTAPAAGLALSELIASGRARTADLAPFELARFRAGPRRWSDSEYRKRVIG
jgi:sarcosine oxidase subunit beta